MTIRVHLLPRLSSFRMIFFQRGESHKKTTQKVLAFQLLPPWRTLNFSENNPYVNCMGPYKLNLKVFSCKILYM